MEPLLGSDADTNAIFEHDGYVDHSTWRHRHKYKETEGSKARMRNRRAVTQDLRKHNAILELSSFDFLNAKMLRGGHEAKGIDQ